MRVRQRDMDAEFEGLPVRKRARLEAVDASNALAIVSVTDKRTQQQYNVELNVFETLCSPETTLTVPDHFEFTITYQRMPPFVGPRRAAAAELRDIWPTMDLCYNWYITAWRKAYVKFDILPNGCISMKPECLSIYSRKRTTVRPTIQVRRPRVRVKKAGVTYCPLWTHVIRYAVAGELIRTNPLVTSGAYNADEVDLSHLCDNPNCVLFAHLSWEPNTVNWDRMACHHNGVCAGHGDYPDCLFVRQ